jgi:hypothetical protein
MLLSLQGNQKMKKESPILNRGAIYIAQAEYVATHKQALHT